MPKKKQFLKPDDDELSDTSSASHLSLGSLPMSRSGSSQFPSLDALSLDDDLSKSFELLDERKQQTREDALRKLIRIMIRKPLQFQDRLKDWMPLLKKTVKKQGQEAILTMQLLSLIWVQAGEQEQWFDEFEEILLGYLTSDNVQLKATAIETLGIIVLLEGLPLKHVRDINDQIQTILEDPEQDPVVLQSGLNAFGVLFGLIPEKYSQDELLDIKDAHGFLLEHEDPETRLLAAENLALMVQDTLEKENDLGDLTQIKRLLQEQLQPKRIAKREKALTKASFREVMESIEDNKTPSIKLKYKHETIQVDTWSTNINPR
ncbi:interferon-related developmental regulator [Gorgonomyces haynaldii]|nr:interferon-related developmental regulator [Gorgonomyces haynaldii]